MPSRRSLLNTVADPPESEGEDPQRRIFDVMVSMLGLVILSPLLATIGVLIKLESPGPVFFKQKRAGKDEKAFEILKFRSMTTAPAAQQRVDTQVQDMESFVFRPTGRKTDIGRALRACSLDELPNLLNVLKGDLHLVGPRPDEPELVEQYRPEWRRRSHVKPGITGLAQIHGRTDLPYGEMMAYDLEYVDRHPFARDIAIMLKTIQRSRPARRRSLKDGYLPTSSGAWLYRAGRVFLSLVLDVCIVLGSYSLALSLKFDGHVPGESWRQLAWAGPLIAIAYILAYQVLGVYRTAWQYGSVRDALLLFGAVAIVTAGILTVNALLPRRPIPLSVNVISAAFIFLFHGVARMLPRIWDTGGLTANPDIPQQKRAHRRRRRYGPACLPGSCSTTASDLTAQSPSSTTTWRCVASGCTASQSRAIATTFPRCSEARDRPRCHRPDHRTRARPAGDPRPVRALQGAGASGAGPLRGHGGPCPTRRAA